MHGSVFLDKKDKVIRPALLWNDQRTASQCDEIEKLAGGRKKLISMVANPALTGFTAPKILWLRENEPKNFDKCEKIKDDVRRRLTGEYATDVSDASGMLLLDVANRKWSKKLLGKLQLDENLFGDVYESEDVTGTLTAEAAKLLGLTTDCMVVGGAGDCAVRGKWHMMGVTLTGGGALNWFVENLCQELVAKTKDPFSVLNAEAAAVPPGAEGLFFLPYLAGERTPHADPDARGCFVGLTLKHTRGHMVRAIMEGVMFAMRDSLAIMDEMKVPVKQMRASGGGAKSPLWRQIQADVFGHAFPFSKNCTIL